MSLGENAIKFIKQKHMDTSKSASFCAWLGNLSGFSISTLHFMTEALLLARKLVLKYD